MFGIMSCPHRCRAHSALALLLTASPSARYHRLWTDTFRTVIPKDLKDRRASKHFLRTRLTCYAHLNWKSPPWVLCMPEPA